MVARDKEQTIKDIRALIGDPRQLDRELRDFKKEARAFSSHRSRLIEKHPKQWVAVHNGKVAAKARTLPLLLKQMDQKGLSRQDTLVRYIDKNVRTFIF